MEWWQVALVALGGVVLGVVGAFTGLAVYFASGNQK